MPTSSKMARSNRSMLEWKRVPMFLILFILSITRVTTTNAIASQIDRFVPQDNYLSAAGHLLLCSLMMAGHSTLILTRHLFCPPRWTSRSRLKTPWLLLHHHPHPTLLQEYSLTSQPIASSSPSLIAIGSASTSYLSLTANTTSPQQHSPCPLIKWSFSMISPS